jgi:hypothetical protein
MEQGTVLCRLIGISASAALAAVFVATFTPFSASVSI